MKDNDRISEREYQDRLENLRKNAFSSLLQPLRLLETATKKRRAQKKKAANNSGFTKSTAATVQEPIAATATVSARRRWAPLRSVPRPRAPTTAVAAATTPTATGFAHRIERRDAVGLCKEPKASCDGAGDGAVVHVDEREV